MDRTNQEVAVLAARIGLGLALIMAGYSTGGAALAMFSSVKSSVGFLGLVPDVVGGILGVGLLFGIKLRMVAALVLVVAIFKLSLLFSLIATGLILTAKPDGDASS